MSEAIPLKLLNHQVIGKKIEDVYRDEGWKKLLQHYIAEYNQIEIDQFGYRLEDINLDHLYKLKLEAKCNRLKERELYRGVIVKNGETRATVERALLDHEYITVLLRLEIKKKIEQNGQGYVEQRIERERLWLIPQGDSWKIAKIEPIVLERQPSYGVSTTDWEQEDEAVSRPISPFINHYLMPNLQVGRSTKPYKRALAVSYADLYWNGSNSAYDQFENDCTNYISQCLHAGQLPQHYTNRRDQGWWYKGKQKEREWWSYSWAVSNSLNHYLAYAKKSGIQAKVVKDPTELKLGDIIFYDWNGSGRMSHSSIVTAFDFQGEPLVNAHTVNSRHRYWDYKDSYAWTPKTQYRFFQIIDYV